ncbi:hypothetical protein [Streptomyces sp. NPDC059009]|uniref:hypothetical protein n=1 Tax=Streptomyces sp. NPDC059009 TaxID=3346694 RepID=UPI0036A011A1
MSTAAGPKVTIGRLFLTLALVVTAALGTVTATASSAAAATCRTLGHAYNIFNGGVYFSGYEGDQRFGVQRITMARGARYELGGNGIKPGTSITFEAVGPATYFQTVGTAGSNCVVNQRPFFQGGLPGEYRLFATYQVPGRTINDDPVVDVTVT